VRRATRPVYALARLAALRSGLAPGAQAVRAVGLSADRPARSSWDGNRRFRFLEIERELSGRSGWFEAPSRLWGYHLHYLDALRDEAYPASRRVALLREWIAGNPPGSRPGWEPYPLSVRLVNALELLAGRQEPPPKDVVASLALQAWWLSGTVEWDVGANHLWKNGIALAWAGRLLESPAAARWKSKGDRIVLRALDRQILPDGFHYELTPSYHAIFVEDLLRFLSLLRATRVAEGRLGEAVRTSLSRTARALSSVLHPDGEVPLFNDTAFGQAPPAGELLRAVAGRVDLPPPDPWGAPAAGLHRFAGRRSVLIVDAGPTACEEQPGHAHADTFSFELSAGNERVVVDAGVYDYETTAERAYARSTAAHNTVEVDGENQSEVWGVFRLGRRARILSCRRDDRELEAAHDGYRALSGSPVHRRRIVLHPEDTWRVEDEVTGRGEHRIVSRVRFHPALDLSLLPDGTMVARGATIACRFVPEGGASARLEEGWYFPRMGLKVRCRVARIEAAGRLPLRLAYRLELSSRS